jgi:hypothetical protein
MTAFIGISAFMSMYWMFKCHDQIGKSGKQIVPSDWIYWLLAATAIFGFYLLLFSHVIVMLVVQFSLGLFYIYDVRPISGRWFLALLYYTIAGAPLGISDMLMFHYETKDDATKSK